MSIYILIPVAGPTEIIEIADHLHPSLRLERLQQSIGATYIEVVNLPEEHPIAPLHTLVLDEEGRNNDRPVNSAATMLSFGIWGDIRGDVLLVGPTVDAEMTSVDGEVIARLHA